MKLTAKMDTYFALQLDTWQLLGQFMFLALSEDLMLSGSGQPELRWYTITLNLYQNNTKHTHIPGEIRKPHVGWNHIMLKKSKRRLGSVPLGVLGDSEASWSTETFHSAGREETCWNKSWSWSWKFSSRSACEEQGNPSEDRTWQSRLWGRPSQWECSQRVHGGWSQEKHCMWRWSSPALGRMRVMWPEVQKRGKINIYS